jgi:hypothetical protein
MAMESQGIQFHRLSTSAAGNVATTIINTSATCINWPAATADFVARGFTTAQWVVISTLATGAWAEDLSTKTLYRIKTVDTTHLGIFGSIVTTKTTNMWIAGYESTTIDELTDFSGPDGSGKIIEATPIDSTVQRIKNLMRTPGQMSVSMNFNATSTSQNGMRNDAEGRNRRRYAIVFTDQSSGSSAYPSWCCFNGYCMNYSLSAAVDNKITANSIIAIDGEIDWSTKVNE